MKSHVERRRVPITNSVSNSTKVQSDINERKLQSRQQQILNIVKNSSCDGIKKLNLLTPKTVTSSSSVQYPVINHCKVKTPPNNKCVEKEVQKELHKEILKSSPKSSRTSNSVQSHPQISKETYNWIDKHFLNNSYLSEINHSKNSKIKDIEMNNESLVGESIKTNDQLNGELEDTLTKKMKQKDILRRKVQKAIREGKIFLIRADIPYFDNILQKRGWIKKYESSKTRHLEYGNFASLERTCSLGDVNFPNNTLNEKAFIYQELQHIVPNLIWDCRNVFINWKVDLIKSETYLNRFSKSFIYTSKLGLALFLEKSYWYFEENKADVLFPRCYNVSEEKEAFIDDYRKTAAVSLVRWFVDQMERNANSLNKTYIRMLAKQLTFAIEICRDVVSMADNEDLDCDIKKIPSEIWDEFIQNYMEVVHDEKFHETEETKQEGIDLKNVDILELYDSSVNILKKIKNVDPQYKLNGIRNIWILKPNMSCCGFGIMMTHGLNSILTKVEEASKNYFLVQKYIEKPLLIKNTKFDVRHWFLVTKSFPLTIWIYKESLLRFSSRPFTFDNYHEIVHLCNTAIQRKYPDQTNPVRTLNWDCEMVNQYLKETYPDHDCEPWYDTIYPRMCQAIVATMLAVQSRMDTRQNSFELYGADFLIADDLSVWLIEINTNPRMHPPSSKITERLYPEVLDSLIKVVLDYPRDEHANTGNFVLYYKQDVSSTELDANEQLLVQGKAISESQIFQLDLKLEEMQLEQKIDIQEQ